VRFSVVIPTMRREAILAATLDSLRRCDPAPDEVIVIDADSEGSSLPVVTEFDQEVDPAVRYIRSTASLTLQRNLGIEDASGDVIVFLDDDVDIEPDLFARLDEAYGDPEVVGATGRIVEPESGRRGGPRSALRRLLPGGGREGTFTRYGYPRYLGDVDSPADVEFMQGSFMSARRELAAQVRFDEQLGGYALAEDEDFSYRLSRLGRIRYLPEIVVHHRKLGFGSQDARRFGQLVVENRAYLFRKNFPQTRLARAQFGLLVLALVGHRIVNGELRGALGLLEGARTEWLRRS
jgi:glycosyltransferase involved in cell wall biosynthesis